MKYLIKLFIVSLFVLISSNVFGEIVQRDTVVYTGEYELITKEKTNDYGEITHTYQVILKQGSKERKLPVSKKTYQSGKITHVIYNIDSEGNRKLARAINIEA